MRWSRSTCKNSLVKLKKTLPTARTMSLTSGTTRMRRINAFVPRQFTTLNLVSKNRCVTDVKDHVTSTAFGLDRRRRSFTSVLCAFSGIAFRTGGWAKFSLPVFCAKSRKIKLHIKLICLSKMGLLRMGLLKRDVWGCVKTTSMRSLGRWIARSTWTRRS